MTFFLSYPKIWFSTAVVITFSKQLLCLRSSFMISIEVDLSIQSHSKLPISVMSLNHSTIGLKKLTWTSLRTSKMKSKVIGVALDGIFLLHWSQLLCHLWLDPLILFAINKFFSIRYNHCAIPWKGGPQYLCTDVDTPFFKRLDNLY